MVAMPSGYYYFGGYDMNAKELTVLMVEPGKHPKVGICFLCYKRKGWTKLIPGLGGKQQSLRW